MYLRKITRQNTDGSSVTYLQIAENSWDSEKRRSRVRVLCTIGRVDGNAVERLEQLVRSIRKNALETGAEEGWKFLNSWEHGPFYVIGKLWESLGIRKIIEDAARKEDRTVPLERAIFAMVANRCPAPRSKLGCYDRWLEGIYFPEGKTMSLHHLYRAMDFLEDHKKEIEEALYRRPFQHGCGSYFLRYDERVGGHLAMSPGGIAVDKDWSIVGASRNGVSDLSRQPSGS